MAANAQHSSKSVMNVKRTSSGKAAHRWVNVRKLGTTIIRLYALLQ